MFKRFEKTWEVNSGFIVEIMKMCSFIAYSVCCDLYISVFKVMLFFYFNAIIIFYNICCDSLDLREGFVFTIQNLDN